MKLYNKAFSLLLGGQAVSWFSDYVYTIAVSWLVIQLHGQAIGLALLALCSSVPQIVFGTLVGPLVDRWNVRYVMIVSDVVRGSGLLSIFILLDLHILSLLYLYVITIVLSLARIFFQPSYQTLFPVLIPEGDISRANSMASSIRTTMIILGLGASGALIVIIGIANSILLNAISFYLSAVMIGLTFIYHAGTKSGSNRSRKVNNYWRELLGGFAYVKDHTLVLFISLYAVILNVGSSPLNVLNALLIKRVLHGGATLLGVFEMVISIGGLIVSLILSKFGKNASRGYVFLLAGIFQGLFVAILGLSHNISFTLVVAACVGATFSLINIPFYTLIQTHVKKDHLGRVMAIVSTLSTAATPLATAACGWLGGTIGVASVYTIGGIISLATGILLFLIPSLRKVVFNSQMGQ